MATSTSQLPTRDDFMLRLNQQVDPVLSEEDRACPICLDECVEVDDDETIFQQHRASHRPMVLHDNHVFGSGCILRWLQGDNRCPLCRKMLFSMVNATARSQISFRRVRRLPGHLHQAAENLQPLSSEPVRENSEPYWTAPAAEDVQPLSSGPVRVEIPVMDEWNAPAAEDPHPLIAEPVRVEIPERDEWNAPAAHVVGDLFNQFASETRQPWSVIYIHDWIVSESAELPVDAAASDRDFLDAFHNGEAALYNDLLDEYENSGGAGPFTVWDSHRRALSSLSIRAEAFRSLQPLLSRELHLSYINIRSVGPGLAGDDVVEELNVRQTIMQLWVWWWERFCSEGQRGIPGLPVSILRHPCAVEPLVAAIRHIRHPMWADSPYRSLEAIATRVRDQLRREIRRVDGPWLVPAWNDYLDELAEAVALAAMGSLMPAETMQRYPDRGHERLIYGDLGPVFRPGILERVVRRLRLFAEANSIR